MIELHRLDNRRLFLNIDLIESIECVPDTLITLSNGKKYIMKEGAGDIIEKMIDYKLKLDPLFEKALIKNN